MINLFKKVIFIFIIFSTPLFLGLLLGQNISSKIKEYSGYSVAEIFRQFSLAYSYPVPSRNINLLVLGLDERNDIFEKTRTTDTILLVSFNYKTGVINTVSLPRDTWVAKNLFKANSFYPYILDTDPSNLGVNLKSEFSDIFGIPIDHYVVLKTELLPKILSIVGPIEVNIDYEINDNSYPNPEYINNPNSNTPIYKNVFFPKGTNTLTPQNILEFVRTRKGSDNPATGGTDLGRIDRQQQVIGALLYKIRKNPNSQTVQKLIALYRSDTQNDLSEYHILGYLLSGIQSLQTLSQNKITIPTYGENSPLYEPNFLVNKQFVFLPRNNNFNELHLYINNNLR